MPWLEDFKSKAKHYEDPPQNAELLGIYRGSELIGYFIVVGYTEDMSLEINQGYLKREARHKNLNVISMKLLEDLAKKAGYKKVILATSRAVSSYVKFMDGMGYEVTRALFSKDITK
jgi:hypothetical protein